MSFAGFLPVDFFPIALCGRSPSTWYHMYWIGASLSSTVDLLQVNVTLLSAVTFGLAGSTAISVIKTLLTYVNDDK